MISRNQVKRKNKSGKFSSEREELITFAKTHTKYDYGTEYPYSDEKELIAYRNLIYSVNRYLKEQNIPVLTSEIGVPKEGEHKGKDCIIFYLTEVYAVAESKSKKVSK